MIKVGDEVVCIKEYYPCAPYSISDYGVVGEIYTVTEIALLGGLLLTKELKLPQYLNVDRFRKVKQPKTKQLASDYLTALDHYREDPNRTHKDLLHEAERDLREKLGLETEQLEELYKGIYYG